MAQNTGNQSKTIFDIDYSETQNIAFQKQDTLRWLVGTLGIFLPVILWILLFVHHDTTSPLDSISHYFYTRAGVALIIILSLLAIFLMVYKGYDTIDFWLSLVAGICAILLLYFPTSEISAVANSVCNCAITKLPDLPQNDFREIFHFTCAGIFLGCLALMSIFVFTKEKPEDKFFRIPKFEGTNIVYITSGILMLLAMVSIPTNVFGLVSKENYDPLNITFWAEVVALESFGWAWFVKGDAIQKLRNRMR